MKESFAPLSLFLELSVLKIDSKGEILETVLNTKKGFNTKKFKTIFSLFIPEEKVRLERLLESGMQIRKKNIKLKKSTGLDEYVDVEISEDDSDIFFFIQFLFSQHSKEVLYDRYVEQLAAVSGKDPMTKVLNRHGLDEQLRGLIERSDVKKRLGLIYIDMDNLKKINDEYGHIVGDKAILNITEILSSTVRDRDLVARLGGDEFLVVVEEVSGEKSTSYGLAERLVNLVAKAEKKNGITLSAGVHVFEVGKLSKFVNSLDNFHRESFKEIDFADKATYVAKKAGKNQVAVSEGFKKFYKLS